MGRYIAIAILGALSALAVVLFLAPGRKLPAPLYYQGVGAEVIAGVNLPMLVKLARVRGDLEIKQAVSMAAEAGRKYINVASESLGV